MRELRRTPNGFEKANQAEKSSPNCVGALSVADMTLPRIIQGDLFD
jgi:hypothetical protein